MYRPSLGHGQSQPQSRQTPAASRIRRGEDPLAELARLIGQEDPFKEFDAVQPRRVPANGNGSLAPAVTPERRAERPANAGYSNGANPAPRRAEHVDSPRQAAVPPRATPQAAAAIAPQRSSIQRPEDRFPAQRPSRAPAAPLPQARGNSSARATENLQPLPRPASRDAAARFSEATARPREAYAEQPVRPARAPNAPESRSRTAEPRHGDRYMPEEAPRHARGRPQPAYQDQHPRGYQNDDFDPQYDDEAYLDDQAEDFYEEAPRSGRGIGFWVVAAIVVASLIAVAFLGVFAYRLIFNSQPSAALITKSNAPTKIETKSAPQTQTPAVAPSNKPIQDRVKGAGDQTQIMRREESPADLTQQQPAPEMQRQAPPAKNNPGFTPPPQQQQQQQQAPQVQQNLDVQQPKRVKTIPLRSDGVPQMQPQPNNTGPMQLQANPPADQDTQAVPPPQQNRSNTNTAPAPQRTAVASLGPAPAPTTSGNYIVQVASHKTPDEAQNAWANLRQQYASIFQGRNADIRKVDLGDRGTFYRAMVGPMSRDQANALCQNLKTQGAGCIVQTRN